VELGCTSCGGEKGKPRGGCSSDYHKDVEPEVTDAKVTIIDIDTGEGSSESDDSPDSPDSQEAPSSSPESEGGLLDETADGDDAALGDDMTRSTEIDVELGDGVRIVKEEDWLRLVELLARQAAITQEIVAARELEHQAVEARVKAENERDQAVSERSRVLRETKQLLDRLADTPLMRRTAIADARAEFRTRFGLVYDEDFLKELERTNG
jgi:hypothetical protein